MASYVPGKDLLTSNVLNGPCGVNACLITVESCFFHYHELARIVASAEHDLFGDLRGLWTGGRKADRAGSAGALSFGLKYREDGFV